MKKLRAPSPCNVEKGSAGPGATGMCVYFATGKCPPDQHDPPSANFANWGEGAHWFCKECTFISLGTDPVRGDTGVGTV